MLPILLVCSDQNKINSYIKKLQKKEGISDDSIIKLIPQGKKFSINQIKEIKKTLINKNNKRKFLTKEISRNEEKSFNSLYKLTK